MQLLQQLPAENIIFIDIETAPAFPGYQNLPDTMRKLWDKKASYLTKDQETPDVLYSRAGIYAEFGKIIVICLGIINPDKGAQEKLEIISFQNDDEEKLLRDFSGLMQERFRHPKYILCAHNGKEFDFPYISRRMIIHGIPLPKQFDLAGKKPWEVPHLDTMELWKFGDFKSYTSLELLSEIFQIPTPKNDMDGSMVHAVYWQQKDLSRIAAYCEMDVVTLVRVFQKMKGEKIISDDEVKWKKPR